MTKNKQRKRMAKPGGDVTTITIQGNQNAVATHGGKATVMRVENALAGDFTSWRKQMEKEIASLKDLPAEDKSLLSQNVEQITREAEKGQKADTNRIERLLNTIAAMAPDIFDVAITTLANPLAGLGLAAKKIGEKAKVAKKV